MIPMVWIIVENLRILKNLKTWMFPMSLNILLINSDDPDNSENPHDSNDPHDCNDPCYTDDSDSRTV
jgi:hypothetical protein